MPRRKTPKTVLVLNQFALPRSVPGPTRHVELFGNLREWTPTILAANRSLVDQSPVPNEGLLRTVPVTKFRGNGASRVINWASYSAGALIRGLLRRPVGRGLRLVASHGGRIGRVHHRQGPPVTVHTLRFGICGPRSWSIPG